MASRITTANLRPLLSAIALMLASMLALAGCQTPRSDLSDLATAPNAETSVQAEIVGTVSGDTLLVDPIDDVLIDFNEDGTVPMHMLGIKAPSENLLTSWNSLSCGTHASGTHLRSLIGSTSTVLITFDPNAPSLRPDGSYAGYVHTLGLDDLGEQQLAAGYAIAEESADDHDPERLTDYQQLTLDARQDRRGLWNQCG